MQYGWIPDVPDQRDYVYRSLIPVRKLPAKVDLRPGCPKVYDQGDLGSCTANAIAAALQYDETKQGRRTVPVPSRLFIYYEERVIEHTVSEDAGAMIRDGIKVVVKKGAPHESKWPYVVRKFTTKPPKTAYL